VENFYWPELGSQPKLQQADAFILVNSYYTGSSKSITLPDHSVTVSCTHLFAIESWHHW